MKKRLHALPPVDSTVKTADGVGTVTEISPLTGFIKVKINDNEIRAYHRDDVKLLSKRNVKTDVEDNESDTVEEAEPRRRNRRHAR